MKPKHINFFMKVAELTAVELSTAKRLQVGAILVKDNRIISIGYNGTPSGWDNNCEHEVDGCLVTKPEVIHAEMNAIGKLAESNESGKGSTMFVTHAPCMECAKLIAHSGIIKVYYKHNYRSNDGALFLKRTCCEIEQLEN